MGAEAASTSGAQSLSLLSSGPLFSGALQTLPIVSSWKLASSPAFVNLCLPSYSIAARWGLKG